MPIYHSKVFPESKLAHKYLDGLKGVEIGGSYHNAWGLDIINVDRADPPEGNGSREACGEDLPVHVIANGDKLLFEDKSFDFVISSHLLEHIFDPIKALKEWQRVARQYIFIVVPHKDRCNDKQRSVTTVTELIGRHRGTLKESDEGDSSIDAHHNVWTTESFLTLCKTLGFNVIDYLDVDDKVGNGFAIVIDTSQTSDST